MPDYSLWMKVSKESFILQFHLASFLHVALPLFILTQANANKAVAPLNKYRGGPRSLA